MKVQKDIIDNCPPILSAINIPICKLAKFLVSILKSLTSNEYTVKDSFTFAEEIVEQDSGIFMETKMLILFFFYNFNFFFSSSINLTIQYKVCNTL